MPVATDRARPANPLSHRAGDDASSQVRTIFFEVVGACIGIATLFIAILALIRMPKRKDSDLESLPSRCNHRQPFQPPSGGLGPTPAQDAPVELDEVETAVEMQCEQSAIRNSNVQATRQPSGTTVEMQCEESAIRNSNVQATQQPSGTTAVTG